jgi:hypothetical protein
MCKFPSEVIPVRKGRSGLPAGPRVTFPCGSNLDPWHGQAKPSGLLSTVHPRWVQTRLMAENPFCECTSSAGISARTVREPVGKLAAGPRSKSVGGGGSVRADRKRNSPPRPSRPLAPRTAALANLRKSRRDMSAIVVTVEPSGKYGNRRRIGHRRSACRRCP